ncbi:uncharacterized protein TNCV_3764871 [Trichonephila clavipes]|uniref:Mutator-like transposase domain-containing protein n=1 Tax=Trichonephila clavipes TaxID=2585209 RepID=A0A8X6VVI6_TRICX|nr:uncharacterized protein TNCV_3764871 [Trichonephila clavipes]
MPGPVFGNRIVDLELIVEAFSQLCCPKCFAEKVELFEDSRYGLCSHFTLKCKCCDFFFCICFIKKVVNAPVINTRLVYGMRQIGKGFAGAFKLCSTLNLPRLTKTAYKNQEAKLLKVVQEVAEESMIKAATEIVEKQQNISSDIIKCGISVDGTWQRRGYTSMNGCVAAISVDTGKMLDIEVICRPTVQHVRDFRLCQETLNMSRQKPTTYVSVISQALHQKWKLWGFPNISSI